MAADTADILDAVVRDAFAYRRWRIGGDQPVMMHDPVVLENGVPVATVRDIRSGRTLRYTFDCVHGHLISLDQKGARDEDA